MKCTRIGCTCLYIKMGFIRLLGYVTLILGILVLIVAVYVTVNREALALNPMLLGAAAVIAGLLSIKKSGQ